MPAEELDGAVAAGDPAVSTAPAPTAPDGHALRALRYGWGEAYRIGRDARRGWWAQRRDGKGAELTAPDGGALWKLVFADYTASPVPRGQASPEPGGSR